MIHALWSWLTRRKPAAPEPEPPVTYSPRDDPMVRYFRRERLQAERATHRLKRRRNLMDEMRRKETSP